MAKVPIDPRTSSGSRSEGAATRRSRLCGVAVVCAVAALWTPPAPAATPAARMHVFHFVDRSRTIRLPDGRREPRPVETIVRSPATPGRHPLVVFGHGYALTPAAYAPLLRAWAAAGYVVAAPVFPLGRAGAPGGPNESDIVNQPGDMRFAITRLLTLAAAKKGLLSGTIDPTRVAVAGHSDGAVTALATAYDSRFRDRRVRAAVVLSGAMLGGMGPFVRDGPPLLAVQGTADPINNPASTSTYFALAHRPKFLLWLVGASHLPPYTTEEPQLGIVERTTLAFLDHYLRGRPLARLEAAARRPGVTKLVSDP